MLGNNWKLDFNLYCPGTKKRLPTKLIMNQNGTVTKNVRYQNLCPQNSHINIAYNSYHWSFDVLNNSMVEYKKQIVKGQSSSIPYEYEILSLFFKQYNITPNWIYCNQTWELWIRILENGQGLLERWVNQQECIKSVSRVHQEFIKSPSRVHQ